MDPGSSKSVSTNFKKRGGTTDLGKDYECLVVAHLALKYILDNSIHQFLISSNHKDFGAFDDVVLELSTDQQAPKYALQLKHVTKSDRGSLLNKLTGENGKFSIQEYYNNYKTLGANIASYDLVLFTNHQFDVPDRGKERKFLDDFDIRISKIQPSSYISPKEGRCFKFEAVNVKDSADPELVKNYIFFFERFYLYTNQPSVVDVEEIIPEVFREAFSCDSDDTCWKYLNFISQWSKREGTKNKLSKGFVRRALTLLLVSPFIKPLSLSAGEVSDQAKLLRELVLSFSVTIVSESYCGHFAKMFGEESNQNISKVNDIGIEYQVISRPVRSVDKLGTLDKNKILWLMKVSPLVVEGNSVTYKAVDLCPSERFVVFDDRFRGGTIRNSIFRNLSDILEDLPMYHDLLKRLCLTVQGRSNITLESFIGANKTIKSLITMNELVQMMEDSFIVGQSLECLPEAHISRHLTRNIIDVQFLEKATKDTFLVISNLERLDSAKKAAKEPLEKVVTKINQRNSSFRAKFHIKEHQCCLEEFNELCELVGLGMNCHHLQITEDGKLEWVHSKGDVGSLEEFREESGFGVPEGRLLDFRNNNNVEIISGEPGIGKTTFVKNLSNNYSDGFWKIIIHPKQHSSYFQGENRKDNFLEYIISRTSQNKFESDLVKIFAEMKRIVYFWDGLDELSEKLLDSVIRIIEQLSAKGFKQFVTTRSHLTKTLEGVFNVLSRTIQQFDIAEQTTYIENRLQCSRTQAEALLTKIDSGTFLGIPLQMSMLVDLFSQNPEKYLSTTPFSIVDLYSYSIDEKLNVYFTKINFENQDVLDSFKWYLLRDYQNAALQLLLDRKHLAVLKIDCCKFLEQVQANSYAHGIITSVTQEGEITFLHLSYAEFLAACYFYENYPKIPMLGEILFERSLKNTRFMFDLMMAKECPIHLAVLYKNLDLLGKHEGRFGGWVDRGGRNPLHILCSWGEEYPLLETEKGEDGYTVNESLGKFVKKECREYVELFELLTKEYDPKEADKVYNLDCFSYADKAHCLHPLASLAQVYTINFNSLDYFKDVCSVFYYSVLFGYTSLINVFDRVPFIRLKHCRGASVLNTAVLGNRLEFVEKLLSAEEYAATINCRSTSGATLILEASKKGHCEVVETFIRHEADLNIADLSGWTPTYAAASEGHLRLLKLLIDNKSDLNAADILGYTPLHAATEKCHFEVVKLLLDHHADVNLAAQDGVTPIFTAASSGATKIVELLVKHKADLNKTDKKGWTPTYAAATKGYFEIVKLLLTNKANFFGVFDDRYLNVAGFLRHSPYLWYHAISKAQVNAVKLLIKFKVNVNITDESGWTPMHEACRCGNVEIFRLLLRYRASVNATDKFGWGPLRVACQHGHRVLAEMLLKAYANADVPDNFGWTPVQIACVRGDLRLVEVLVDNEASVNWANGLGKTCLHLASEGGHGGVVELLLQHGAVVHVLDHEQNSPLHYACANGHYGVVSLLMVSSTDSRVSLGTKNKYGFTPTELAKERSDREIVELLLLLD